MTGTDLTRSDRGCARLATGYALRAGGPRPVRDCELVTAGAGGIIFTTADMARYVAALLAGGSGEHGQILKPETVTSMFAPHYQPDPRLPGGRARVLPPQPGRAPRRRARRAGARFHLADVAGGRTTAPGSWRSPTGREAPCEGSAPRPPVFLGLILGVARAGDPGRCPSPPGGLDRRLRLVLVPRVAAGRAEVARRRRGVFVRRGQLTLRPSTRCPRSPAGCCCTDDPDDPYVFRIDLSRFGLGTSRVAFSRSPHAGVTAFHLDLDMALCRSTSGQPPGTRGTGSLAGSARPPQPPPRTPPGGTGICAAASPRPRSCAGGRRAKRPPTPSHATARGAGVSSTTVTELWRMSATELAEAIRSGQASSREVVEAHLRRIEQVNPAVNAIPVVLGEQALEAAREADRAAAGRLGAQSSSPPLIVSRSPQPPGPVRPARR